MWGAIIQAIDHALGRMNEGAGAGIKVAKSQSGGGGAPISNPDSGAGNVSKIAQDLRNQNNDGESEKAEAAEKAKIGSNATSTGEVPSEGGQSKGGAGPLGNIGSGIGGGDAAGGISGGADIGGAAEGAADIGADAGGEGAEEAADAASNIVSDENAKSAKNVGSENKDSEDNKDKEQAEGQISKWEAVRQYAANAGKGFANAGAIATGSKAAKWEDIDTSAAKKAAENTVKNWRKRNFNKAETKEGK